MSQRFIRCPHCGLSHEGHVVVCPTTGLQLGGVARMAQRRKKELRQREEAPERMIGWVLDGKYRISHLIGQGGMSAIYEAEQFGLDRRVAVKVLHPVLADDPDAIARLRHEAQVVSTIGHQNICEVFDLGRTPEGIPYLVMERLVGESLAERIRDFGPLLFTELAPLALQVLAALDAAHHKGILHRDLKPENLFIEHAPGSARTTAKLLDFGISKSMTYDFIEQARLTHTGMVMGTPYYMAPEQARGDSALDQRVDLWALGVILYESLTGRRPFVATNYNALLVKILTSRPRPVQKIEPRIPPAVAALVDRALSKLREDRFQTAREFADAIVMVQQSCARHEGHVPPMLQRAGTAGELAHGRSERSTRGSRDWGTIDDPETFIDDASAFDEALLPARRAYQPPHAAYERVRPAPSYEDLGDPMEPTIQDRPGELEDEPRDTWWPPPDPSDTDVMRRSELEAAAQAALEELGPQDDTEVLHRRPVAEDAIDKTLPASEPGAEPSDDGGEPPTKLERKRTRFPDSERTMLYDLDQDGEPLRARRLGSPPDPDDDP